MSVHSCLVLYGNSVFLAGIKADLERHPGTELVAVDAGSTDVMERVRHLKPFALLFDLAEGQPDYVIALLQEQPNLLLIGVDPSSDDLLVLSNQPVPAFNLSELIELTRSRDELWKESFGKR
jgi:hypothetical protein